MALRISPVQDGIGLPKGSFIVTTMCNIRLKQVIAEVQLAKVPYEHQLYWRHATDTLYTPLLSPSPGQSVEYVVAGDVPTLFAVRRTWHKHGDGQAATYRSSSEDLLRIDIGGAQAVAQPVVGVLPPGSWPSKTLRCSDDGTSLLAAVGFQERLGPEDAKVSYYLTRIDLTAKTVEKIALLPGFDH